MSEEMEIVKLADSQLFVDVTPEKDGGVTKTLIRNGEGDDTPFNGCTVYLHYIGRLLTGEKFDSSRDRNDVFSFQVGKGEVIKGWELVVPTMHKNEICEVKIAPEYGYGKEGFPPNIPGDAELVFEIELLSWDDEDVTPDGGVKKRVIKEGEGISKPNLEAKVKCHIRGTLRGNVFDERDVEFVIGEGHEVEIVEGIEKALLKMRNHERTKVFIKPQYGFGDKGHEDFGIPPDTEIEYEICLFSFEKALELYEMNYDEKLEKCGYLKDRGLKFYQSGEYKKAIQQFTRLLKFVEINKQDSDYPKGIQMIISGNSNMALCYMKLQDNVSTLKYCNNVLELQPDNVKAHYRSGEACMWSKEYKKAVECFAKVLEVEPSNTAAKKQLTHAKSMLSKQVAAEKQLYSTIFSKVNEKQFSESQLKNICTYIVYTIFSEMG